MSYHTVYLLLGSNLKDRKKNLEKAQSLIIQEVGNIKKKSEIMETEAIGFDSDNLFLNQLLVIETELSPMQTLQKIENIEKKIGRTEKSENEKYQDRIIDIDILLYDALNYHSEKLIIPHQKNLENRGFVKVLFAKLL